MDLIDIYRDEIEEFKWNQEMYFKDPEQLMEIYTRLEEGNVALIQSMQETEQSLENLRNSLKQKKAEFDQKLSGLREHKLQLEKNKAEKYEKVRALKLKFNEPTLSTESEPLDPFREMVAFLY